MAGPIADRIMERSLGLADGTFDMPVAWLSPAPNPNPVQRFTEVHSRDSATKVAGSDGETAADPPPLSPQRPAGRGTADF